MVLARHGGLLAVGAAAATGLRVRAGGVTVLPSVCAAQVLNLGCGRLPKIAAVMLVSDAVLDTVFDPDDPQVLSVCLRV